MLHRVPVTAHTVASLADGPCEHSDVESAKISGSAEADETMGEAATYGRFATGRLVSILGAAGHRTMTHKADEKTSLVQNPSGCAAIGRTITPVFEVVTTDGLEEIA